MLMPYLGSMGLFMAGGLGIGEKPSFPTQVTSLPVSTSRVTSVPGSLASKSLGLKWMLARRAGPSPTKGMVRGALGKVSAAMLVFEEECVDGGLTDVDEVLSLVRY
jgi:hypothetical protein